MSDVSTLTLIADHVTPVRAYACMRSHAPDRSSFLLEWGGLSVAGYRAASEILYPPGGDVVPHLVEDLASVEDAPAGLAERFSRATVGFLAYEAALAHHGVKPWENQTSLGRLTSKATVAVFDHAAGTVTIAGPSLGSVKRCAWEMTHGPELGELKAPDPEARPEHVDPLLSDEVFLRRLARAPERAGEASGLRLARTFCTPLRNAEPFEVYRALRLLAPAPYRFFLEFASTDMAPGLVMAGVSSITALRRGPGDVTREELYQALPSPEATGGVRAKALAAIRELEGGPRGIHAGAVGYRLPDGTVDLALALRAVLFEDGSAELSAGTTLGADSTPASALAALALDAGPTLAAVRAAQLAADAREVAEAARQARIAKEQAAKDQA